MTIGVVDAMNACPHTTGYLFLAFGFSIALNNEVTSRVNHVGMG